MSLNGLDHVEVKQAVEGAVAEAGGWFLLKYAARDAVELLDRGTGGIVECRLAISRFEEVAPLFGFLRYRRRNVLIKYVPQGCSRLVQARVAVHFNVYTEQMTAHNTVFAITAAKELQDSALSAACSLHTASESNCSSSSSLRKRRLMEIAEDVEDEKKSAAQVVAVEDEASPVQAPEAVVPPTEPTTPLDESLLGIIPPSAILDSIRAANLETSPPQVRNSSAASSPQKDADPRKSTQSLRPELFSYSSYGSGGKPKIKLAPRPSLEVHKRPHTSNAASPVYRPISSLPAGLKMHSKSIRRDKGRPRSQCEDNASFTATSPPPIPEAEDTATPLALRPHTSGGHPHRVSAVAAIATSVKLPTITPEKARLMKAMELRKKQKLAREAAATTAPESESIEPSAGTKVAEGGTSDDRHLNDIPSEHETDTTTNRRSFARADESDTTRSDCSPISPMGVSEHTVSTRASSISETMDEAGVDPSTAKPSPKETAHPPFISEGHLHNRPSESGRNPQRPVEDPQAQMDQHILLPAVSYDPSSPTTDPFVASVSLDGVVRSSQAVISETARNSSLTPGDLGTPPNNTVRSPSISEHQIPIIAMERPASGSSSTIVGSASPSRPTSSDLNGQRSPKTMKRRGLVEPIKTTLHLPGKTDEFEANLSSDDELMDELHSAVVQEAKPMSVSKSPLSPSFPVAISTPEKKAIIDIERPRTTRSSSMPLQKADAFRQELAQQIPVPKIPTSFMPAPVDTRRPSSPHGRSISPAAGRSVSAGAAYLSRINSQSSQPLAKKVAVSSGVSQRIRAFERISTAADSAPTRPITTTSTAFFSVCKADTRPSSSRSIKDRTSSLTRSSPSPGKSRESSPPTSLLRGRTGSVQRRVDALSSSPAPESRPVSSRDTISVTAHIVRDTSASRRSNLAPSREASQPPPELCESVLSFEHHRASPAPSKTLVFETIEESPKKPASVTKSKDRRSSVTIVRDLISDRKNSQAERRRSMTRDASQSSRSASATGRSRSANPSPARKNSRPSLFSNLSPPSTAVSQTSSPTSPVSPNDERSEKRANRASRILQRMSASFGSRKGSFTATSPTVPEDHEALNMIPEPASIPTQAPASSSTPTSIEIGDVNVQFPDTLLWKRRCVLLDPAGYLILSPALSALSSTRDQAVRGATRKFHFGELAKLPDVPDVEMQELPNSVVLDFLDGTGLQIACEDRAGQKVLLGVLQEAYRSWATTSR